MGFIHIDFYLLLFDYLLVHYTSTNSSRRNDCCREKTLVSRVADDWRRCARLLDRSPDTGIIPNPVTSLRDHVVRHTKSGCRVAVLLGARARIYFVSRPAASCGDGRMEEWKDGRFLVHPFTCPYIHTITKHTELVSRVTLRVVCEATIGKCFPHMNVMLSAVGVARTCFWSAQDGPRQATVEASPAD